MTSSFTLAALASAVTLAAVAPARAGDWRVEATPIFLNISGHDQHVLTVHQRAAGGADVSSRAVTLDVNDDYSYRVRGEWDRGDKWTWGASLLWVRASQVAGAGAGNASGSADQVIFEVADRTFSSTDPSEILFYRVLEDTTVQMWTADLYALRTVAETERSRLRLQVGVKVGDFDNDYRAAVGIENVEGRRLDASSNYGRMQGPLVGLVADVQLGKSAIEAAFAQSVLVGTGVELTSLGRDFDGPFSEMPDPDFVTEQLFRAEQDVAIPVTDFRLQWSYRFSRKLSLLLGAETSVWWDVPVPPGVIPGPGGQRVLHENTLVLFGIFAGARLTL